MAAYWCESRQQMHGYDDMVKKRNLLKRIKSHGREKPNEYPVADYFA